MEQRNKKTFRTTPLKIISLFLGYTFWYIFGNTYATTAWITLPLCFYNIPYHNKVKAPETISVKISGARSLLRSLDCQELAIHINAERLQVGKNKIAINAETIFLPESIKVVHYSPSNPIVELIPE